MRNVIIVLGTRPEAIKLLPVYVALKKSGVNTLLVSTGQHKQMLLPIFDFFQVQPDHDMEVMTENQSLESLTAQVLQKCSLLFKAEQPRLVVVQGDTTTAMAAALSAFYQHIPIAHVEAGLRSYDHYAPFPEEVNRRVISLAAALHFTPTASASRAVRQEHVPGKVHQVGNTVIDSLLFARAKVKKYSDRFAKQYAPMFENFKRTILITGHRRENFGEGFINICEAIRTLANAFPAVSWVYPVHLNPNVLDVVRQRLGGLPNVFLIDPVPYDHMVFLMSRSYFVLTDSGGIQEEAPALGKPVIVMRRVTERPEGVKAGCCVLAGNSKAKIVSTTKTLLNDKAKYAKMAKAKSPYGKGDSARQIAQIVKKFLGKSRAQ